MASLHGASRVCRLLFWQAGAGGSRQGGEGGREGAPATPGRVLRTAHNHARAHTPPSMHLTLLGLQGQAGFHPIPHASPTQQGRSPSSGGCTVLRLSLASWVSSQVPQHLYSAPLPGQQDMAGGRGESPAQERAQGGGQGEGAASGGLFVSDPRAWGAEAWGGD